MEEVEIRPLKKEDHAFLFSSWLRSYKQSRFAHRIKNDIYFMWHHILIERLLSRPSVSVHVAHMKGDADIIFGFLVSETMNQEPRILHYVYVKDDFRGFGLARELFNAAKLRAPVYFSHWTYLADPIVEKHQATLVYDPYKV